MGRAGTKMRRFGDAQGNPAGYMHWCPGCESAHGIWIEQPNPHSGAKWTFDGNLEAPTFQPSILCYETDGKVVDDEWVPGPNRITTCHYFLQGGVLKYLDDCKHALRGQSVPLPTWGED